MRRRLVPRRPKHTRRPDRRLPSVRQLLALKRAPRNDQLPKSAVRLRSPLTRRPNARHLRVRRRKNILSIRSRADNDQGRAPAGQ